MLWVAVQPAMWVTAEVQFRLRPISKFLMPYVGRIFTPAYNPRSHGVAGHGGGHSLGPARRPEPIDGVWVRVSPVRGWPARDWLVTPWPHRVLADTVHDSPVSLTSSLTSSSWCLGRMLPGPGYPPPGTRARGGGSCRWARVTCALTGGRGEPAQGGGQGRDAQLRGWGVQVGAAQPEKRKSNIKVARLCLFVGLVDKRLCPSYSSSSSVWFCLVIIWSIMWSKGWNKSQIVITSYLCRIILKLPTSLLELGAC